MKDRTKFTTLTIDRKTSDILTYLAKITGRNKVDLIREIFEQIVTIGASQKEGTILRYESSIISRSLRITFEGPSRLVFGKAEVGNEVSDEECFKKLKVKPQ